MMWLIQPLLVSVQKPEIANLIFAPLCFQIRKWWTHNMVRLCDWYCVSVARI